MRKGFTLVKVCIAIFMIAVIVIVLIGFMFLGHVSANMNTINTAKVCNYNVSHYGKIVGKTKMPCMGPVIEKDGRTILILEQ